MYYSNNSVFGGRPWEKDGLVRRMAGKEGVQGAQRGRDSVQRAAYSVQRRDKL